MNPENKSATCSIRIAQVSQDAERPIAQSTKATRIVGKNKHITIELVYDEPNIRCAEREARRNKKPNYGVKRFDKNYDGNINRLKQVLASYKGWLQHADALHLWNKVTGMKKFSELNINVSDTSRNGERFFEVPTISASFIVNREIVVLDFIENVSTKNGDGRMCILIEENNSKKKILTNNPRLKDILIKAKEMDALPFSATFRSRQINGSKIDYYFE